MIEGYSGNVFRWSISVCRSEVVPSSGMRHEEDPVVMMVKAMNEVELARYCGKL